MEQHQTSNFVFQPVPHIARPAAGTKEACAATGGTITYTANGLIHNGGKRYAGKGVVEDDGDE